MTGQLANTGTYSGFSCFYFDRVWVIINNRNLINWQYSMGIRVIGDSFYPSESKLKGDHDALQFQQVRRYRIHPIDRAYVKDMRTGKVVEGVDNVARILDGELDLIIGE